MALWLTIAFLIACGLVLAGLVIIGNYRIIEDGNRHLVRTTRGDNGNPSARTPVANGVLYTGAGRPLDMREPSR